MGQMESPVMPCSDSLPYELPTVAVISSDGTLPASFVPFAPRVITDDLSLVQPTDDVTIINGERSAATIAALFRMLGRYMPPVLVTTKVFDEWDIIGAFDNGVTSYLIVDEVPEYCIVDATLRTAKGQSSMSPNVASLLFRHVHRSGPIGEPEPEPEPEPTNTTDLSPRERQIMELLVGGHTIIEIADHLHITEKTVRNYLSNIFAKLHVRRQSEAILLWLGHDRRRVDARSPVKL